MTGNGKPTMAKPAFAKPRTLTEAITLIHHTLAYYEHCRESHLDKVLEHPEQEADVALGYALAKDLAYGAKLCTKEARGEYVKTATNLTEALAIAEQTTKATGFDTAEKAVHAIIGYQGGQRLLDALGEEMRHTDAELSVARRMHDSAMMIGALMAGIEATGDRSSIDVSGLAVKVATKKTAKKR